MMTVRHNERKCACNVAANEQNGRERPALMNSLQISSMCDPSLGEAGDARRATSPSRLFDGLSAAKTLNERIGFRIRTQKRKEFFCGVEILSFPFSAIRVSACSSSASLLQGFSSRMRLSRFDPSKRASFRFVPANHTSAPDYLAGKRVRLTTADRSAGGIAQGGLIHSHEAAPSDSRVDIRGLVDRARDLVHRFLDRILRVTSGALGVTLDLLRGSLSCNRSEPTTEPIPSLTDRLVRDARRTIQGAYRSTSSPIAGKSPRSSRAKLLDE